MLTNQAIREYLNISVLSFEIGYINIFELVERIKVLLALIDEGNEHKKWVYKRLEFLGINKDDLLNENPDDQYINPESDVIFPLDNGEGIEEKEEHPRLDMVIASRKYKWIFHKSDADFYPSIPHGHAIRNEKIKLDPYRGLIHDTKNKKTIGKESKKFLIDLWNDVNFRKHVYASIIFYENLNPNFIWRVPNHRKLPRKK
ncbi:hypothetical protein BK131_00675 [Paenibacillus amylolyticus]|uniref:Uncharacterized protein n=1 Tax=Paenibacillus amylolyticus TaxID=1451 RepID=A0A1R1C3C3_PAEAM|nr:hypothetical protein [Paenibacillus amylolyticus]OMF16549.1 hypothetical protein BK131_00675 [Paenibacillus amylolyticus]